MRAQYSTFELVYRVAERERGQANGSRRDAVIYATPVVGRAAPLHLYTGAACCALDPTGNGYRVKHYPPSGIVRQGKKACSL